MGRFFYIAWQPRRENMNHSTTNQSTRQEINLQLVLTGRDEIDRPQLVAMLATLETAAGEAVLDQLAQLIADRFIFDGWQGA